MPSVLGPMSAIEHLSVAGLTPETQVKDQRVGHGAAKLFGWVPLSRLPFSASAT